MLELLSNFDFTIYGETGILVSLFLMLLAGIFGLPVPEDIVVIGAGVLAHQGKIGAVPGFIVCWSAVMLGDNLMYFLGRVEGMSVFERRWVRRYLSEDKVIKARELFVRKRIITIFVARHLFYLRGATFFSCGTIGMSFRRFFIADGFAACVSVPAALAIGYFGADGLSAPTDLAGRLENLSVVGGCLAVGCILIWAIYRRVLHKVSSDSISPLAVKNSEEHF